MWTTPHKECQGKNLMLLSLARPQPASSCQLFLATVVSFSSQGP